MSNNHDCPLMKKKKYIKFASILATLLISQCVHNDIQDQEINRNVNENSNIIEDIIEDNVNYKKDNKITDTEMEYFLEIALGSEYGSSNKAIKKWNDKVKIKVFGSPTIKDIETLEKVIEEINVIIEEEKIKLTKNDQNLSIYFIPENQFKQYIESYVPVNYGFFWTYLDRNNNIIKATVLVSTDKIPQLIRSHIIREELTQSLGLSNDSLRYPESIFYADWTHSNCYAEIDKRIIKILYSPEIKSGMNRKQVVTALNKAQ